MKFRKLRKIFNLSDLSHKHEKPVLSLSEPLKSHETSDTTSTSPAMPSSPPLPFHTSFRKFLQLPVELQVQIWELYIASTPPSKLHNDHFKLYTHRSHYPTTPCLMYQSICLDPTPAAQICQLSRDLAWQFYISQPRDRITVPMRWGQQAGIHFVDYSDEQRSLKSHRTPVPWNRAYSKDGMEEVVLVNYGHWVRFGVWTHPGTCLRRDKAVDI